MTERLPSEGARWGNDPIPKPVVLEPIVAPPTEPPADLEQQLIEYYGKDNFDIAFAYYKKIKYEIPDALIISRHYTLFVKDILDFLNLLVKKANVHGANITLPAALNDPGLMDFIRRYSSFSSFSDIPDVVMGSNNIKRIQILLNKEKSYKLSEIEYIELTWRKRPFVSLFITIIIPYIFGHIRHQISLTLISTTGISITYSRTLTTMIVSSLLMLLVLSATRSYVMSIIACAVFIYSVLIIR